jgi:flagellar motility protein MotE (MotC chaperone)
MNTNTTKKISNKNIINNQINLNNIDIIPTIENENENNLNYINKEKYFENYSNKEENNSKISEKFIIENANSKVDEEIIKENTKNKNRDVGNENKISKNNASKVNIKLEEEKKKIKEVEENIKDFEAEIEDEQDSLDEESHKINDSKSIISNYIIAPLTGIQDLKSYAPSLYSEFKDNISNVNDLISNKEGGFSFPPGTNETEIEIMNENGKGFKSFIETPRASGTYNKRFTHKNINYNTTNTNTQIKYSNSSNKSINQKIKNICDKINRNTNEIQKMNEKIINLEEKIKIQEEYNKKYELWIEKEEEESELLINMLNFLNNQRK